ncbi:MAG: cytochrome c biogenesis protein CcdA [Saprospiraceae bacterium]
MSFNKLLFFIFIGIFNSNAQILDPVHWESKINNLGNQEYELVLSAKLDEGWCIYSQSSDPDAAIPSEISIDKIAGLDIIGKVEERGHLKKAAEPLFDNKILAKYYEHVDFVQKFKASSNLKIIKASAYYMCCNSETCIPPTTKSFELNIQSENNSNPVPVEEKPKDQKGLTASLNDLDNNSLKLDLIHNPVKVSASIKKISEKQIAIEFIANIENGWHIYSSQMGEGGPMPTEISYTSGDQFKVGGKIEEESQHKYSGFDDLFEMNVVKFKESVKFIQKLDLINTSIPIKGFFTFQTCDDSKCLPPKSLAFEIKADKNEIILEGSNPMSGIGEIKIEGNSLNQNIASIKETLSNPIGQCGEDNVKGTNHLWTFLFGFIGGLLALLTPCVFPMIPLTVSFFTKGSKDKKSGIRNGLIYAFSIVVIYVFIGIVITSFFGATALNELSTNWLANVLFFIVFIFFAFSFFGYYEITLPSSWSNKSDAMADKGGLIGIFFMAFTLALVSFSCTGPIIGTAIVESAKSPVGPTIVMLGFSMALALPFGLFAAFPAYLNSLPRSGSWMTNVKVVLGFLELALAFKFLSIADMTKHWGILGYELFMGLWVIIFGLTTIYLFGLIKFPHDSPIRKLSVTRWIFALLFLGITIYLGTGFRYSKEFQTYSSLKLMSGLAPPTTYNYFLDKPEINAEMKSRFISFTKCANNIDCFHDYYEALTYAREQKKPLFIDFTGYGCVNCRKTEEHIWVDDKIRNSLNKDFVLVSLYVDDRELLEKELVSTVTHNPIRNVGNKWADFQIVNFNQNSQPLYVIISPDEKVMSKPRGFKDGIPEYFDFIQCGLNAYKNYSTSVGFNN